jgi:hypothetical protein
VLRCYFAGELIQSIAQPSLKQHTFEVGSKQA